jgi:hypothetical protein
MSYPLKVPLGRFLPKKATRVRRVQLAHRDLKDRKAYLARREHKAQSD